MSKVMTREKVYDYLSEEIVNNNIKAGESIIEAEIAEKLGISRTPIREALGQLKSDGLLMYIPNRGYFVTDITQRDIDEICDLRKMFEIYCLKYCVENITDASIARMKKELSDVDSDAKIAEYFESEASVHRVITSFCPNRRVLSFIKGIDRQEERLRRTLSVLPNRLEKVQKDHMLLLDMLELRDYDKAASALLEHIEAVRESLVYAYKHAKISKD